MKLLSWIGVDSPGKNTGVGCHFLLQCIKVKSESEVTQSCPTLCNPTDCSPPGSSAMGFSRQEYWSGVPYTEELYKKDLHDPDKHDGVITHLDPDIM